MHNDLRLIFLENNEMLYVVSETVSAKMNIHQTCNRIILVLIVHSTGMRYTTYILLSAYLREFLIVCNRPIDDVCLCMHTSGIGYSIYKSATTATATPCTFCIHMSSGNLKPRKYENVNTVWTEKHTIDYTVVYYVSVSVFFCIYSLLLFYTH